MHFVPPSSFSLYQFMTVAGLLIYLFCFYKYEGKAIEIEKARAEDAYTIAKDTLDLNDRINLINATKNSDAQAKLNQLWREKTLIKKRVVDRAEANKISVFYIIGFLFGGAMFLFGAGLWYYRIQRYEDKILRRSAE